MTIDDSKGRQLRAPRIELDRLLESVERLRPTQRHVCDRADVVRVGRFRIQPQGLVVAVNRLVVLPFGIPRVAAVVVGHHTFWIEPQGLVVVGNRLVVLTFGFPHYANALQKAKRLIRKNENWSDPFYWSSLVLVGPN